MQVAKIIQLIFEAGVKKMKEKGNVKYKNPICKLTSSHNVFVCSYSFHT